MARTDTLGHFLTDVADAIREKTGDENPINASEFDTAISNIKGGLDIQNGRLVNYKATSGTVAAGTFVKLNTVYDTSDVRILNGESSSTTYTRHHTTNLIHLRDNIYCYEGGDGNGGYLYTIQVTENGIIKYANRFSMGGAYYDNRILKKLDDSTILFVHSAQMGYPNGMIVKLNENNIWNIVVNDFPLYPSGSNFNGYVLVMEDADYWYLHVNDNSYNSNSKIWKINKTDYSITSGSTMAISMGNGGNVYNKILLDSNKLLYTHNNNSYAIAQFDLNNLSYTRVGSYHSFGLSNTLYIHINNKHIVVGHTTIDNAEHTVVQEFTLDSSYNKTVINQLDLGESLDVTNSYYGYFGLHKISNTAFVFIYHMDKPTVYARIIDVSNSITAGEPALIETLSNVPSYYSDFGIYGGFDLAQPLGNNKFILLCGYHIGLYTIDNALNINQESGSVITVSPATNKIIGITTTECTTTTAGDVYLLDV